MIDMASITAAIGSMKAAGDIAVGLVNLKTMSEVHAKAVELNQKIIVAQHEIFAANAAQTECIQRISELEKQIANIKAWEAQKQRYQMRTILDGITVYALKKSMSDGEPPHYICANCYEAGKRSIIQNGETKDRFTTLVCPTCISAIPTGYRGFPERKYAEDIKQSG